MSSVNNCTLSNYLQKRGIAKVYYKDHEILRYRLNRAVNLNTISLYSKNEKLSEFRFNFLTVHGSFIDLFVLIHIGTIIDVQYLFDFSFDVYKKIHNTTNILYLVGSINVSHRTKHIFDE